MAIRDNNVTEIAKTIAKDVDIETITNIWEKYLKPFLKTKIPGAFGEVSVSHTVFPYNNVCFVSRRYRNIVRAYSQRGNWTVLNNEDGVLLANPEDIGKETQLTIVFGVDIPLESEEAVCGRMLAELALMIQKGAIGVESISNSFDVSTLTTKYSWTEYEEYAKMLNKWWVDDSNKKEAGCLV